MSVPHLSDRAQSGALIVCAALWLACDSAYDQVIEALTTPAAVRPGDAFVATSRVCNRGDSYTEGDVLDLSVRASIGAGGTTAVGSRTVPPLAPGQCHAEETPLVAPFGLPDGPYELVGRLTVGGHERASAVFGIGHLPELVVEELHAPPSATPWSGFGVSGRVCNRGTEWAPASALTLYLSDDGEISGASPPTPDVPAGSLAVPDLPPGVCADVAGGATADVPGDMLYLLVGFIDEADVQPELIESNNRGFDVIGIGYLPDLVVRSLEGPSSITNGASFNVSAVVCNDGTSPSNPTDVSIFFSQDTRIQPPLPSDPALGDFWLGALTLDPLMPGACFAVTGFVDGGVPFDGEWYLGAWADESSSIDELIEPNNGLAGPLMGVGFGPDLVVEALVAPPSAEHGMGFDVEVELCNRGTAPANSSTLLLHLSADAVLEPIPLGPDPESGMEIAPSVDPGSCVELLVPTFVDSGLNGEVQLFATADAFEGLPELIESNNVTPGPLMGVGLGPDLTVRSLTAPPSVHTGAPFDVEVEVCNQGTAPSSPTAVSFYHSVDATIEGAAGLDLPAGGLWLTDSLVPGSCRIFAGSGMAHSAATDGEYTLGARVDDPDTVPELRESNNAFAGPLMGVGFGPDLVPTRLEAPPTALPDGPLPIDFEVCNQGTAVSPPAFVSFYDSADTSIQVGPPVGPEGDRWLGDEMLPTLEPGRCFTGAVLAWLPSGHLGERHLAAVADEPLAVPELVESNNTFFGPLLGVGLGPDLVVTLPSAPASVFLGAPLVVDTQVCNQGTDVSGPSSLWVYLSKDTDIEGAYFDPIGSDPWLGEVFVPSLVPGACHDEPASGPASVPGEGAWHLGAIVDEGLHLDELVESNNTTLGPRVGVGAGPDLVVSAIHVPSSAQMGISFAFSVDVCNVGTTGSPVASLTLYHSADAQITPGPPGPPGPDLPFATLSVDPLAPGACVGIPGTGMASLPDEGAWFTGAVVDEENSVWELVESNNDFVGPVMGLGLGPDLLIFSITAPAGLMPGLPFDVSIDVCNMGTADSPPSMTTLYHSDDATLDAPPAPSPDGWLADLSVPELTAYACASVFATLDPAPPEGVLFARVDDGDDVPELIETNNVESMELVVFGP